MNDKFIVNAIVTAVRHDLSRGIKKDEIMKSLSNMISRDLFEKVRDQV